MKLLTIIIIKTSQASEKVKKVFFSITLAAILQSVTDLSLRLLEVFVVISS